MQSIAAENNLAETAFVVPDDGFYHLRWFTPEVEVDLCGHATLASAAILMKHGYTADSEVEFRYPEGTLRVARQGERLVMDFPAHPAKPIPADPAVAKALGAQPLELRESRALLAVFETEAQIRELKPDFAALAALETLGVIVSARGDEVDFVSRFFAPAAGIPEDPATGSAHCTLVPYWSQVLGRTRLHALQLSRRRGELFLEDRGERVLIAGDVVEYLEGRIHLDDEG